MINLLPPQEKKQIRAGQANVLLWRYCVLTIILAGLLLLFMAALFILMTTEKNRSEAELRESEENSQKYQAVQKDVNTFSENLKTAKAILDKDVRYSKIATKIARVIPSGITLQSLILDAAKFDKPADFIAAGRSYDDALRLKTAMESSPLFRDVSLVSVARDEKDGSTAITIKATIVATEIKKPENAS